MGFQYQTIASSTLSLRAEYGLSTNEIGILIGVYFLLGIALALPGGAIGARFGSKRVVLIGLGLMVVGGILAASGSSWPIQVSARILVGTGGVLLNVMMSKMVSDWFPPAELPTAMGIFVSSWTLGVAVGLVTIPAAHSVFETSGVFVVGAAWAALGFVLVALLYSSPPSSLNATAPVPRFHWLDASTLTMVLLAGMMWGWFNAGFGMIFSFGPATVSAAGFSAEAAGAVVSLVLWTSMVSVPLGGYISDKTGAGLLLTAVCPALAAVLIIVTSFAFAPVLTFALLGLIIGIPAGSIMAMPSQVLAPEQRAVGMGVFFTVFYAIMVGAPIAAAAISSVVGTDRVAYQSGALCMVVGLISLAAFVVLRRRRLAVPAVA